MNVETAIHNAWGTDTSLTSLVPAARFYTDRAYDLEPAEAALPYVVLAREGASVRQRASDGREYVEERYSFHVHSDLKIVGRAIRDAIRARFNRRAPQLQLSPDIKSMQWTSEREQLGTDGVYLLTIAYLVLIEQPVGVA